MEELALFAEISPPCEIHCKICSPLLERRARPTKRDLIIDYPRSRLGGLRTFHVNTLRRAGTPTMHER